MTAPRSICRNTKKTLAETGPSIHDARITDLRFLILIPTALRVRIMLAIRRRRVGHPAARSFLHLPALEIFAQFELQAILP